MNSKTRMLLELRTPLPEKISKKRANCFNAVQLFWEDEKEPVFTSPGEFVSYLSFHFSQLLNKTSSCSVDVSVVWSRSVEILPVGTIKVEALERRDKGYPFGLVIEHAFVHLDSDTVFQKRDPSALGPYEVTSISRALEPYLNKPGFEITHHRRRQPKST